jgi:hypothetical protein
LSVSCKDEDLSLSTSVIVNIEKNSGKISLPDKVNLVANDVQNNNIIEAEIPIDQKGKGNIKGLATSKEWRVKFWTSDFEENLGYITNTGFKLYKQGIFLPESPVFFAGVTDFDFSYQTDKSIYLILKPQTRCLTFRLVINPDTNNHPQRVSGIFSGVASERMFGLKQAEISENNLGHIPLKFTSSVATPYIFEASYRVLGISEEQKCEIRLYSSSDEFPPLTIDLTDKLKIFNDFFSDEIICTINLNNLSPPSPPAKIEIETGGINVMQWEENGKREYHL